jgi:hypothetical protein
MEAGGSNGSQLEMEADSRRHSAWTDIVGSTKCGDKIVERLLVRQIDYRQAGANFVFIAAKNVVVANAYIEEITGMRCELWSSFSVPGPRYREVFETVLRCRARRTLGGAVQTGRRIGPTARHKTGVRSFLIFPPTSGGQVCSSLRLVWGLLRLRTFHGIAINRPPVMPSERSCLLPKL